MEMKPKILLNDICYLYLLVSQFFIFLVIIIFLILLPNLINFYELSLYYLFLFYLMMDAIELLSLHIKIIYTFKFSFLFTINLILLMHHVNSIKQFTLNCVKFMHTTLIKLMNLQ